MDPLEQHPDLLDFNLWVLVHSQFGPHHLLEEVEVHREVGNTKGVLQALPCFLSSSAQVGVEVGGQPQHYIGPDNGVILIPLCHSHLFGVGGVGRINCLWPRPVTICEFQHMLGAQEISHPLLPGMVVHTIEEGDELGDVFGGHVDVVSKRNQQSAKNLECSKLRKMTTPWSSTTVIPCWLPSDLWQGTVTDSEQLVTSPGGTPSTMLFNHTGGQFSQGCNQDKQLDVTDGTQQWCTPLHKVGVGCNFCTSHRER